ncbi:MAG TPA: GatB/YqeY domain-containing protein [Bacteroidia bacterium]
MTLEEKVNADIKAAMLAKDQQKLDAIRGIKAALLLLKSSGKPVTPEEEIKAMQKMVKQRRETAEIYKQQNRKDLEDIETFQANLIETYLPKQMSEAEIKAAVEQVIAQTGAKSMADMGKVMGVATKQLAGKADGKLISEMVKKLLSQ